MKQIQEQNRILTLSEMQLILGMSAASIFRQWRRHGFYWDGIVLIN